MPNIVKQVGVQSSTTASPSMYNFQSDVATFVSTATLTPSTDYKYTINTIDANATLTINSSMIANQETYIIFINSGTAERSITVSTVSGATTYFTGDFEDKVIKCVGGECVEISILKLVNGSTNYYFVRGA